jgi:hypothetical protein
MPRRAQHTEAAAAAEGEHGAYRCGCAAAAAGWGERPPYGSVLPEAAWSGVGHAWPPFPHRAPHETSRVWAS